MTLIGIVAKVLRDADELDAMLTQASHIEFEGEVITGKAAERMNDHDVKGRGIACSEIEKALKPPPAVIGTAQAGIDELKDDIPASRLAKGLCLAPLVRN